LVGSGTKAFVYLQADALLIQRVGCPADDIGESWRKAQVGAVSGDGSGLQVEDPEEDDRSRNR